MQRRYFLTNLVLSVLAVACSSKVSPDPQYVSGTTPVTAAACKTQNPNIVIAVNHGHSLIIPIVDVITEMAKSYTLSLGDFHTHNLDLSTSDMQTLKADLTLTINTSFDAGHSHSVTITCIG